MDIFALVEMSPRRMVSILMLQVTASALLESLDGVEAMWCTPDKQATTSSGWDSHLKK